MNRKPTLLRDEPTALSVEEGAPIGGIGEDVKDSTVLIIDDEPTICEVVQIYLEDAGYRRILTTTESTRALDIIYDLQPDAILLDVMMPEVTGLDILGSLRGQTKWEHLPVIVLTSSTDTSTKLRALELGATDFLSKPVDASELALRLRNTLVFKAYRDRLAYVDSVTGCFNRTHFLEQVENAIEKAERGRTGFVLMEIGLDRFKNVNDAMGYAAGDQVLATAGRRITRTIDSLVDQAECHSSGLRPSVSRTGGDEFMALVPGFGTAEETRCFAESICAALAEPCQVGQTELFMSASIGIAAYPEHGDATETLLNRAGTALSYVKRQSSVTTQIFGPKIDAWSEDQLRLEGDLRRAIERNELVTLYQPKLDLHSGKVTGAEALVRWAHPTLGEISPAEFIPLAEKTGLIVEIGAWVLEQACLQARAWGNAGHDNLKVAVNVSARQFASPELVPSVLQALVDTDLAPSRLTLELTESMILEDPELSLRAIDDLKRVGVRVSMDDFGTGYSSLSYLKRLPLDELKLDRSFVSGIASDRKSAAIVTSLVTMARGLGLEFVAEGVETREQLEFLAGCGAGEYQGFLFSQPVSSKEFLMLASSSDPTEFRTRAPPTPRPRSRPEPHGTYAMRTLN